MVFSSHLFIYYFLPILLLTYYALYRAPQRWRNLNLVLLGYAFYGWANPKFIFLMFGLHFLIAIPLILSLKYDMNRLRGGADAH